MLMLYLIFNRAAEQSLAQVEVQRNFPLLVIKLIGDQSADPTLRFAAALFFKNYVKRHWVPVRFRHPGACRQNISFSHMPLVFIG